MSCKFSNKFIYSKNRVISISIVEVKNNIRDFDCMHIYVPSYQNWYLSAKMKAL